MADGLIDTAAEPKAPNDRRIYGTAVAEVIENCDQSKMGRVRLRLPWLPGFEPWARVAAPTAGTNSGVYCIPKAGDEVLVMFQHGDVREPYVVGSVRNERSGALVDSANEAETKWIIRTAKKQEIVFDDAAQTITIKSANGQRVTLGPKKIEVSMDDDNSTSLTFDTSGNVTLKAKSSIKLEAPTIDISASQNATLGGSSSARIDGGSYCSVSASRIDIG